MNTKFDIGDRIEAVDTFKPNAPPTIGHIDAITIYGTGTYYQLTIMKNDKYKRRWFHEKDIKRVNQETPE